MCVKNNLVLFQKGIINRARILTIFGNGIIAMFNIHVIRLFENNFARKL